MKWSEIMNVLFNDIRAKIESGSSDESIKELFSTTVEQIINQIRSEKK